mmetsp:Transcript_7789/g.19333  ORF Transcript_7789/g.19333 Transcript_7789/m.19333 type:complete len:112 (-) Transcript_7789:169-504(-)
MSRSFLSCWFEAFEETPSLHAMRPREPPHEYGFQAPIDTPVQNGVIGDVTKTLSSDIIIKKHPFVARILPPPVRTSSWPSKYVLHDHIRARCTWSYLPYPIDRIIHAGPPN